MPLAWLCARYCWWRPTLPDHLPGVLMYHMVSPQGLEKHRGLRVDPAMFERQVAWLAANDWEFVTMSELSGVISAVASGRYYL